MDKAYHVGRWSILAVSVGGIQNPARVAEAILATDVTLRQERGQGTISEFDSGGCRRLSVNASARVRSCCGALYRVQGKGNCCVQNRESFPEPVSEFFLTRSRGERGAAEDWILSANFASPRETLSSPYSWQRLDVAQRVSRLGFPWLSFPRLSVR